MLIRADRDPAPPPGRTRDHSGWPAVLGHTRRGRLPSSVYSRVWDKAREATFTPEVTTSPHASDRMTSSTLPCRRGSTLVWRQTGSRSGQGTASPCSCVSTHVPGRRRANRACEGPAGHGRKLSDQWYGNQAIGYGRKSSSNRTIPNAKVAASTTGQPLRK